MLEGAEAAGVDGMSYPNRKLTCHEYLLKEIIS